MKKYILFILIIIPILLTFCRFPTGRTNPEMASDESVSLGDSAMIVAAGRYANYCAGCHWEDLSWFTNRKWKHGSSVRDIVTSTRVGFPDFGMEGYAETFTNEEMNNLARYIYIRLNLEELQPRDYGEKEGLYLTELVNLRPDTIITGLKIPWGLAFLPGGDMLVNEKDGRMLRYNAEGIFIAEIEGLPEIHPHGQGGLMDIRLHPDYASNGWIYFAYSRRSDPSSEGWNTALMRAKLRGNQLTDKQLLYTGIPGSTRGQHFGCKITFDGNGHVFFGIGDRGFMERAQDLSNDCGKILRLNEDGSIPEDNPFVNTPGARPAIWSYGVRNPQGLVISPFDGKLWESEHGPKGGDELNLILPGMNYGWPEISFGINYNGTILTADTAKAGMEQPVIYWVPSIAPCGMTFVTGNQYPGWEGNILIGSLRFNNLVRLELSGDKVVHQEVLVNDIGRMRNVEISPEGFVYVSLENPGMIIRLTPSGSPLAASLK
jgi:aldose sugar dehydrogenase